MAWWGAVGHPQHVRVLVAQRARQVGVDLVEAEHEGLRGGRGRSGRRGDRRRVEAAQALERVRGCRRRRGTRRKVERLEDERRHAARALAPVVERVAEHQLVAGARHAHVEQPPFLLDLGIARRKRPPQQGVGNAELLAPAAGREATVDQADHVDDRPLEPLGLVDGDDGDRVRVGVEIGRRRVVAGLDQRLQVRRQEDGPIVREQARLGPDDLEEPGHVSQRLFGGRRPGLGERAQ